jgi:streptogramin lyase
MTRQIRTPFRRLRGSSLTVLMAVLSCSASAAVARVGNTAVATGPSAPGLKAPLAAAGTGFFTLPPCRVLDTRAAAGVPLGRPALPGGTARSLPVRRLCGLPDSAIAVSLNLTVTSPTGAGDLRLFPGGTAAPAASAINYAVGQTRANSAIVPVGVDGSIVVQSNQLTGAVDVILDVNGYFVSNPDVPTPKGLKVKIRPATEVELTFDNVTSTGGTTSVQLLEFTENRARLAPQSLKAFFLPGSPEEALVPDVQVPAYVTGIGKGGPGGTPTFLLAIIDTQNLAFQRTAEFHGLEDFRLGWDPPCVVLSDPTQEPRTFYAWEVLKNEPSLVEETILGGPGFVDISSGCGSNKGSGWNFSLYLTGRDTRTPDVIAQFMLDRMADALTSLGAFILDRTFAANLSTDVQTARTSLGTAPATSMASMAHFIDLVDGNPTLIDNNTRNVSGELAGRAQSATYMIKKLVAPGTFAEFAIPTAGAGAGRIALGPDGNLWFAEYGGNKIGRVTRAGVMTEFAVPTAGSQPYGIAAGPDGNLWFTEGNASKIGRITPAGVITEFTIPTAGSRTLAITAGPDGNLWFTELNGNKIGRITPAGVITEFPAPAGAYGIVTGPDGNLWFTEYDAGNKIGIITTAGVVVKEFPVPVPPGGISNTYGIAVGPDGNVWFVENIANKIGYVTAAGAITEFALPAGARPAWLTAAPDGNIWFTEDTAGKIGRITPAGVLTEFPIPTAASAPYGIVVGPDGNLWFAEGATAANKIGRITP